MRVVFAAALGVLLFAATLEAATATWNANTDGITVGYKLYYGLAVGSETTVIDAGNTTSVSIPNLIEGTTYHFHLRAYNSAGVVGPPGGDVVFTVPVAQDTQPPTSPSALSVVATSATAVTLTWTASTDNVGVANYQIVRCTGSSCSSFVPVGLSPTTSFINNTGLVGSTTYRYMVLAMDAAGNQSGFSNTVNVTTLTASDLTAPSAPTALSAVAVSPSNIALVWVASTDNVGVTGYRVERCAGIGCTSFAQIGLVATTTYNDTGLLAATVYRYQVRATDAAGNLSQFSPIVSATTQNAVDQCSFPLGNRSILVTITGKLNKTGSGKAGSRAWIQFTAASPNSPLVYESIRANGVDIPDSTTPSAAPGLRAVGSLWFTLPPGTTTYSVYARNEFGCEREQPTGFSTVLP